MGMQKLNVVSHTCVMRMFVAATLLVAAAAAIIASSTGVLCTETALPPERQEHLHETIGEGQVLRWGAGQ